MTYCDGTMGEEETEKCRKVLFNKIKYQTSKMNKTFNELVKVEIENNEAR